MWPGGKPATVHKQIDGTEVVTSPDGSFQLSMKEALASGLTEKRTDNEASDGEASEEGSEDSEGAEDAEGDAEVLKEYAEGLNTLGDAVSKAGIDEQEALQRAITDDAIPDDVVQALDGALGEEKAAGLLGDTLGTVVSTMDAIAEQTGILNENGEIPYDFEDRLKADPEYKSAMLTLATKGQTGPMVALVKRIGGA